MNRTIKEATVKRCHYDTHDQLRQHLGDLVAVYNFACKQASNRAPRLAFKRDFLIALRTSMMLVPFALLAA